MSFILGIIMEAVILIICLNDTYLSGHIKFIDNCEENSGFQYFLLSHKWQCIIFRSISPQKVKHYAVGYTETQFENRERETESKTGMIDYFSL